MNHTNNDTARLTELERKIRQAKKDLQSIFDGITDGIVIVDRERKIKRVNNAILRLFGKETYHELLNTRCCKVLFGSDTACDGCLADKVFETGDKQSTIRTYDLDGLRGRIFQLTAFPLQSEGGGIYAVVECYRDVTREINMERQLLEVEKAQNMKFLTAGIAHELRNPLAVIYSSAQLCLADMDEAGPSENLKDMRENLEAIIHHAQGADRTIRQLMGFARPLEANFESGYLQPIIDKVCDLVRNRCRRGKINLIKKLPPGLPQIRLDEISLTQATLNFVTNAIEAVSAGGGISIEVIYHPGGDFIFIFIRDTGKGVTPVISEYIFEPFFTTKEEGVGLGMSIAQRIVNAHGGSVDFESRENEGSTVTIKLPVKERLAGVGMLKGV